MRGGGTPAELIIPLLLMIARFNAASPRPGSALLAMALAAMLTGCADVSQRARAYAQKRGMTASVIQGTRFRHQIWTAPERGSAVGPATLYVFIEGDGAPWIEAGSKVAHDPTPHRPLALELAAATSAAAAPHAVLYLGRPCYFEPHLDANCTPDLWTSGRYSDAVVDSLVAAVNRYTAAFDNGPALVLIGYSGGGTLAVLMAAHLPSTRAVITIAGNLDVTAWVRWHGYLPLTLSENPAAEPHLPDSIRQWHLVGGKDGNMPEALERRYFDTMPPGHIWRYPGFDHVCCWVQQWSTILARIDAAIMDANR